jgi:hypothetical protein
MRFGGFGSIQLPGIATDSAKNASAMDPMIAEKATTVTTFLNT